MQRQKRDDFIANAFCRAFLMVFHTSPTSLPRRNQYPECQSTTPLHAAACHRTAIVNSTLSYAWLKKEWPLGARSQRHHNYPKFLIEAPLSVKCTARRHGRKAPTKTARCAVFASRSTFLSPCLSTSFLPSVFPFIFTCFSTYFSTCFNTCFFTSLVPPLLAHLLAYFLASLLTSILTPRLTPRGLHLRPLL